MKILLIDLMSILFRAFHATGDLRSDDGKPSGAVFGSLSMIDRLVKKHTDYQVVCVTDKGSVNFRHQLDPNYKANRPPMPPELASQIEPIYQLINAYGLPLIAHEGVEADDVIATYTRQAQQQQGQVVVASNDKDLMQLVDKTVSLYDGIKGIYYDEDGVVKKFGISPPQMGDYLALVGDTSDNIKGVEKVGPKTAAKWLNTWNTLDNIVANAAQVKGVVGENLRYAIDNNVLALARQLVTLKSDVEPLPDLATLKRQPPDHATWDNLCASYDLNQLKNRLRDGAPKPASPAVAVTIIDRLDTLQEWCRHIAEQKEVTIACAVDGEVPTLQLIGIALRLADGQLGYIPLLPAPPATPELLDTAQQPASGIPTAEAVATLKTVLQNPDLTLWTYDGKKDWQALAAVGITPTGVVEDSKIAAYIANAATDNTLEALASGRLAMDIAPYKTWLAEHKGTPLAALPADTIGRYLGERVAVSHQLGNTILPYLSNKETQLYREVDRPLMPILAQMERTGMTIDIAILNNLSQKLHGKIDQLEEEAFDLAGEIFNLNSPKQVAKILFEKIGATAVHKTKTKAYSTDERTLEQLSPNYPLAKLLLKHRGMTKIVSTYSDKLPQLINPHTQRLHTQFSQTTVLTGRLSSSSPNLQNIPIRSKEGQIIRRAFVAESGKKLISADYSQIELRVMAFMAKDEAMLSAFAQGLDIHQQTAAEVFSLPLDAVSDEQRRMAKAINFGLLYGMSSYGLVQALNISKEQADFYIDRYFSRYPNIAEFMNTTRQQAPERGWVQTFFGRRIPLSGEHGGKSGIQRLAINAPIQGTAADIVKMAMIEIDKWLVQQKMQSKMILQVHDEIVFEAVPDEVDDIINHLPSLMNITAAPMELIVNIHVGDNWDEAH